MSMNHKKTKMRRCLIMTPEPNNDAIKCLELKVIEYRNIRSNKILSRVFTRLMFDFIGSLFAQANRY